MRNAPRSPLGEIPVGSDVPVNGHTITTLPVKRSWFKIPTSIQELTLKLLAGWGVTGVILGILSLFSTLLYYLSMLTFVAATLAVAYEVYYLMRARQKVLVEKDIAIFGGFIRLIAWDPVEGVLFLENKTMGFFDDDLHDGHGGIRLIYPVNGDELALRVRLEVQTLQFFDKDVLTREYLPVTVQGTCKWRIVDIRKFYLLLSRELRVTSDHKNPQGVGTTSAGLPTAHVEGEQRLEISVQEKVNLAIKWLQVLAGEQTRAVVSRISSGLLVADRLSVEMPEIKAAVSRDRSMLAALAAELPPTSDGEWTGAADGLARSIHDTLKKRALAYGIDIEDVSLQEIRLPDAIVEACAQAAQTAYLPLMAQRKAAADVAVHRANLSTDVELMGKEAVAMREVAKVAPSFTLVDFLSQFMSKGLNAQAASALAQNTATVAVANQLSPSGNNMLGIALAPASGTVPPN